MSKYVALGNCEDCRFWEAHSGHTIGDCLRHAPAPFLLKEDHDVATIRRAVWPTTDHEDCCGEFKALKS